MRGVLRLGCVQYLNARPLIHGWPGPVEFGEPAALCRKLAAGELDVALVSSFEYLRDPVYTIVDNVAICSDGPVASVFVAHKGGRMEEMREIALDPASRSAVNLLRCLLPERQLTPRLISEDGHSEEQCARLMIGDQAIRFRRQAPPDYRFWDLGEAWKESTALPFVYALWLMRPEVGSADEIAGLLRERRDANLAALDQLIAAQTDFPPDFCASYFRDNLRFNFGEREKLGVLKFRFLCEKHGLLPPNTAPLRLA